MKLFMWTLYLGAMVVFGAGCGFQLGSPDDGVPPYGRQVEGDPMNPESLTGPQGTPINICHNGGHVPQGSSLGSIGSRSSVDGTVTVVAEDGVEPTMGISAIGYEPCYTDEDGEEVCTGGVYGIVLLTGCVRDTNSGAPQCPGDDLDGDLSELSLDWLFYWQGTLVMDDQERIWIDALFGNQFSPAVAEITRNDDGDYLVDWDFVMYPNGTDAPFPSDDPIGELVFADEQTRGPTGAAVLPPLTDIAWDIKINGNNDSPITGSLDGFIACPQ